MNIIRLELTEQEAKIYDEVMEKVDKTAAFLAGLSPEERLDWLKEHQYIHPISFEREIGGTANDVSDIVPMQDLFNEWHAKNTSDKVRRVMQSRGNTGIPLTTSAPYGYKKAPEDKNKWLVDEPAAEIVQRIFQMCISGLGPTQIARKLRSEGVMTPSEYFQSVGVNCPTKPPAHPCNWSSGTVAGILDRQ